MSKNWLGFWGDYRNVQARIGCWWRIDELVTACHARALQVEIINQPDAISNYRMDALIKPK